jgi:battenin
LFLILRQVDHNPDFPKTTAFFLSMIPSFIMGSGSAFGESTMLGYFRNFPKDLVVGFSSGTGLAGVVGALLTFLFKFFDIHSEILYLAVSPLSILYFFSFWAIEKLNVRKIEVSPLTSTKTLSKTEPYQISHHDVDTNEHLTCENFKRAFMKGKRFILNLALVYFLEYVILSCFSERVARLGWIHDLDDNYQYELFSLSYQVGVFLSRSSLFIMKKITYVEILTLIQFANFILWLVQVFTGFIHSPYIAIIHLVVVGLMGGGTYVACFYFILNSFRIESELKELCVNIGTIFNDFGILLSSLVTLLLDNTLMKI